MLRFIDTVCFTGGYSVFSSQGRKNCIYTHPAQNWEKTYDLNQVDIYYYKPRLIGGAFDWYYLGYMKMDTHDDVFVHGALTGVEVGIFTKREVKKIIEKTGIAVHII